MTSNFYDKVAKKFGGHAFGKGHVKRLAEYPTGDPEKIFKEKLLFEDFDSEKDKKFLKEYVAKFKTEKGIRFPRHRVVIVAKKPL